MSILQNIIGVIQDETVAMEKLIEQIGESYEQAVEMIKTCQGKVIITGVGKSGHIGKKMAASFASTGTSAFFVHPTEGLHGDLGMIQQNDVVILISNSGETSEVVHLLPTLDQIGCQRISITARADSTIARAADVSLAYQYEREADPLGLAPTTSSTLTLVIGDALAVAVSIEKNFTKNDFHLYHPGGSLGKYLSSEVEDGSS